MTGPDETDHSALPNEASPEEDKSERSEATSLEHTVAQDTQFQSQLASQQATNVEDEQSLGELQQPDQDTQAALSDTSSLAGGTPTLEAQVPAEGPAKEVSVARDVTPVGDKPVTKRAAPRSTTRKTPASSAARPAGPAVTRAAAAAKTAVKKATDSAAQAVVTPLRPTTLAIDVGGTGLKASVLDAEGKLVADRVRVLTPRPCSTKALIDTLATLVAPLPSFDRVSVGFPGVVRKGVVLTAPHLVIRNGTSRSQVVPKLVAEWKGFDLESALCDRFGRPVRIANDADLQGLDVVSGSGLEFVVTLGTGVGTALLLDGKLAPHLELAHHPFRKGEEYDAQLGDASLRRIGFKKWHKRLEEAIGNFERLINYDRLYIGGGNARLLVGHVDASITIVDNLAGILGGIKLWDLEDH